MPRAIPMLLCVHADHFLSLTELVPLSTRPLRWLQSCQHATLLNDITLSSRNDRYRLSENNGRKTHALLMAPNPESNPRIVVPSTTSRDNAVVVMSDDA